ncbi:MAG TPA: hypothetical protein VF519_13895 [Mycobacteriales bacterium]|jgi:hypothetical protein
MTRAAAAAVAAAALALTACGGGGDAPPRATPSASATTAKPDDVVVREALAATRAKATATFTAEATTAFGFGSTTSRVDGEYDLKSGRARMTQTLSASPPQLLEELSGQPVDVADLTVEVINTADAGYLRMPAWPASIRNRWLRVTRAELAKLEGVNAPEIQVFPGIVTLLEQVTLGDRAPSGDTYHVLAPAPAVFEAFPSSATTRRIVAAGLDPDTLTGTVEVDVTVVDGVVAAVELDAIEVFRQAWRSVGQEQAANAVVSLRTTATLNAHGRPVSIAVPTGAAILTQAELDAAT